MNPEKLKCLLQSVADGTLSAAAALDGLRDLPYEDMGFAKLDHHRGIRTGAPEVVYCEGKKRDHLMKIVENFVSRRVNMLLTRVPDNLDQAVLAIEPAAEYHADARIIRMIYDPPAKPSKKTLVVAAGTADISVAEEAAITADTIGCTVERLYDVGVAGIHRLLDNRAKLDEAGAIVVVAGMEGALASVVGGLTSTPVVAVPTSVGYGASFGGLSALLAMLTTCAPGVSVMNIDNGFGGGYFAAAICRKIDGL